jgi:DNA-binding NarL/FixJ family response regulator
MLVDDSEVVRVGLAAVLAQDVGLRVVGQASTSEAAVVRTRALRPDLVLLDVRVPEAGGIEAGRQILELMPATRILFLSAFADPELVRAAILIGAHGYLLKEIDASSLIRSIKRVAAGDSIMDPAFRADMVDWVLRNVAAEGGSAAEPLSPQQERVIALVAEGKTNREIAEVLDLRPKTVKNYVHLILKKLNVTRRSQAAAHHARRLTSR